LINLKPINKLKNFASYIGKRSYCVYAVHWPIMFFLDHIYFVHSEVPLALQFVSYIFFIVIGIEITYRLIEVPAITYSRTYFKGKKHAN
jgi:peptidoglycan/LPS O-acetylase OafA/YrhL